MIWTGINTIISNHCIFARYIHQKIVHFRHEDIAEGVLGHKSTTEDWILKHQAKGLQCWFISFLPSSHGFLKSDQINEWLLSFLGRINHIINMGMFQYPLIFSLVKNEPMASSDIFCFVWILKDNRPSRLSIIWEISYIYLHVWVWFKDRKNKT